VPFPETLRNPELFRSLYRRVHRRRGKPRLYAAVFRFAKQFFQHSDAFIHVLFFEQEGRQEAQDGALGGVEEHALGQGLLDQRARGNVEHEALNESASADFAGSGAFAYEFL
jgi:hypothetical protein